MAETESNDDQHAYVCIHCGREALELYHSYSPTVLKISECNACNMPVDGYIECDLALVLLDLFLQKLPAYRHILCNSSPKSSWRLLLIFILCDAYYNWVEQKSLMDGKVVEIYDLEWNFYLNIIQASIEALCTILVLTPFCLWIWRKGGGEPRAMLGSCPSTTISSLGVIIGKLQIGFYGNVLVLLAVIWEQHQSVSFIALTRVFLIASHVQIVRALCGAQLTMATVLVLIAMGTGKMARFVATWIMR